LDFSCYVGGGDANRTVVLKFDFGDYWGTEISEGLSSGWLLVAGCWLLVGDQLKRVGVICV
jgi:hypothetical protein